MNARRTAVIISVAAISLAGLSGCGNSTSAGSASPSSTVAGRTTASATDVAFAQSMIPHHQQAVEMADLALAPRSGASPEVKQLAAQIKAAQDPEIAQMSTWLQQWGAPTSMPGASSAAQMPGMDHSGHDMGGMSVSGMMTTEQMDQLAATSAEQFDDVWLAMMVEHHQGAIAMAEQAKTSSDSPDVTALTQQIITAQQTEISTMRDLLQ